MLSVIVDFLSQLPVAQGGGLGRGKGYPSYRFGKGTFKKYGSLFDSSLIFIEGLYPKL